MKKLLIVAMFYYTSAHAECVNVSPSIGCVKPTTFCDVILENKQTRFSLDIWAHVKDRLGAVEIPATLPASKAIEGSTLDVQSNAAASFWKGSFNPTKKSVTRVKKVLKCGELK